MPSSPTFTYLRYGVDEGVCTITFDRPEKRNALNTALLDELDAALDRAEADPAVRVVLFRGAGTAFSAGYDLTDSPYLIPPAGKDRWSMNDSWEAMRRITGRYQRIWDFPKPTVAAVHGPALATGGYFMMLCDIAFAAQSATFGHQAQQAGGISSLPLWTWMLGMRQAKYLLLTGRLITAREAQRIGLVTRVFPDAELEPAIQQLCRELVRKNPQVTTALKNTINADYDMMGLRAGFHFHGQLNAANKLIERGENELTLREIVFGRERMEPEEQG